jgi:hypothetical protein
MKYCLHYYSLSQYKDTADELMIIYDRNNIKLIDFAKERPENQRLVVAVQTDITEEHDANDIDIFAAAAEVHPNIAFKLYPYADYIPFKEKSLSYFYELFTSTWDDIVGLANRGVSDIYVCNILGFNIDLISAYCKSHNINVRVFPNIAQSNFISLKEEEDFEKDITKFFIRPEDVPVFEEYVDYMEFWGSIRDQDEVYRIYKEQKWLGKLSQIIIGYRGSAYNRELSSMFALHRINCKKRCNYKNCSMCYQFVGLSTELFENNKTLQYPKILTREEYEQKVKEFAKLSEGKEERDEDRNEFRISEASVSYESELSNENSQ